MEATHIVQATSAHHRDSVTSTHSYGVRDHVQRFNSLAHAMHQIAANYNGKIQSLKESLQETHKMVSSAETMLLESEQRCAEIRDVNSRLQHRLDSKIEQERSVKTPARRIHSISINDWGNGTTAAEEIIRLQAEVSSLRDREALQAKRIVNLRQRLKEAEKDKIQMAEESRHLKEYIKHLDDRALSNSMQQNHCFTQDDTDQYTITCYTPPNLDFESAGQHAALTTDKRDLVDSASARIEAVEPSASSSWLSIEKSWPTLPSVRRGSIKSQTNSTVARKRHAVYLNRDRKTKARGAGLSLTPDTAQQLVQVHKQAKPLSRSPTRHKYTPWPVSGRESRRHHTVTSLPYIASKEEYRKKSSRWSMDMKDDHKHGIWLRIYYKLTHKNKN